MAFTAFTLGPPLNLIFHLQFDHRSGLQPLLPWSFRILPYFRWYVVSADQRRFRKGVTVQRQSSLLVYEAIINRQSTVQATTELRLLSGMGNVPRVDESECGG